MARGWFGESKRHGLSAKGISTAVKQTPTDVLVRVNQGRPKSLGVPQKNVDFNLPVQQAVIVPSTQDADKNISQSELKRRVEETQRFLAKTFGGFTSTRAIGGYFSDDKNKVIEEKVVVVTSFSGSDDFKKKQKDLLDWLGRKQKQWGQESIGYELEDDLYYVKK